MQAIILAGGKGERLRAEVPDLPKPLAPINGRPFLEYQMSYWIAQGVDRFVLSVGYKAQMVIEKIGNPVRRCRRGLRRRRSAAGNRWRRSSSDTAIAEK